MIGDMRQFSLICLLCIVALSLCEVCNATSRYTIRGFWHQEWCVEDGERIAMIHILPVRCYSRGIDMRRYARLVTAVKKVYPIAKTAREKMADMEADLAKLETKKDQKTYIKQIYEELLEEYTPVLKRMSRTNGRVLVRLIDRETEYTAYEVVKEFRGAFVASFWQGIGRLFGQDLKSEYGSSKEDQIIEQIIIYYEAGLI